MTVVVDCANGAMAGVAPSVLMAAGADVIVMNDEPNGQNINDGCGATSPHALAARVIAEHADLGIAYDGDGDRLVAVSATGQLIDGDYIMAISAADLSQRGLLRNKGIAVTVMSNLGFHHAMRDLGIDVVVTPVGDRSVLAALEEFDFVLGGEQSGHIVHRAHATTGDGLLASASVLAIGGLWQFDSLKEIFITVIACMAVGVLIGFLIGERSMCNQLGGMYSNDYGRCFPVKEEVRVK
jgi:phosphoglucosamine mutase